MTPSAKRGLIVLVAAQKGGVGKSTAACNISGDLAASGINVLLVGTDKQPSAQLWAATRVQEGRVSVVAYAKARGEELIASILGWSADYAIIVIDAGGADSSELRSGMLIADIMITPCKPSQFDVNAMFTMDTLVAEARQHNPKLQAMVLVNEAPSNVGATDVADMREALTNLQHYKMLDAELGHRKAYKTSARLGLAVTEFMPRSSKPALELRRLMEEVFP